MEDLFAQGFSFGFGVTAMTCLAGMAAKKVFNMIVDIIKQDFMNNYFKKIVLFLFYFAAVEGSLISIVYCCYYVLIQDLESFLAYLCLALLFFIPISYHFVIKDIYKD